MLRSDELLGDSLEGCYLVFKMSSFSLSFAAKELDSKTVARPRVLIVEDDESISELLEYNLQKEGMEVTLMRSGEGVLGELSKGYSLVLLDLMLPGISGLDVCRMIRQEKEYAAVPIIMVTAKTTETDIVSGLELGADDYIKKPFSPREVVARVRAVLRRKQEKKNDLTEIIFDNVKMNFSRHKVWLDSKELELTATEFKILKRLVLEPGHVFSRDDLIKYAMGENVSVLVRTIDVHVTNLRKKLGSFGTKIESVRGVGYRLNDDS